MISIIEKYMNNLKLEDISSFANSKNCYLNQQELEFTYNFIKKNWKDVLQNPSLLDLNHYKKFYSEENFYKIKRIYNEYSQKFSTLL